MNMLMSRPCLGDGLGEGGGERWRWRLVFTSLTFTQSTRSVLPRKIKIDQTFISDVRFRFLSKLWLLEVVAIAVFVFIFFSWKKQTNKQNSQSPSHTRRCLSSRFQPAQIEFLFCFVLFCCYRVCVERKAPPVPPDCRRQFQFNVERRRKKSEKTNKQTNQKIKELHRWIPVLSLATEKGWGPKKKRKRKKKK